MDVKIAGKLIKALAPGKFAGLCKIAPVGSLEARQISTGPVFYWRFTMAGKTVRVAIGPYDSAASPKMLKPTERGYSIEAAVRAAEALALEHHAHRDDGGHVAIKAAKVAARRSEVDAKKEAAKHTLSALLDHYCDHLEALGRVAHRDARSIFSLHVKEPWPAIAALPANQVTSEQIADMMRRCLDHGKGRTANKLRSYVRAAYQTARASRSKASVPVHFKAYKIASNPAADTEPDESQNKADRRPLSADELRIYWRAIKNAPGFKGAALRLHLLTGGQRIEQLVNLRTVNVSKDAVLLFDGKGRPGKPLRPHTVPLTPEAARAMVACEPSGEYALSTDGGATHVAATTLSAWAAEAARAIPLFQAKRVRSGVETLLASLGVSAEIRGRLQSHGISGVQARHYDGHDYLAEKRRALSILFDQLELPVGGNVTPIGEAKRRRRAAA